MGAAFSDENIVFCGLHPHSKARYENARAASSEAGLQDQLPAELHAELMRFLDMRNLRKMLPISRLPYALFGKNLRKWNARNEWTYPGKKSAVEARKQNIYVISQHGLDVCMGNGFDVFSNVFAKNPFNLAEPANDIISAPATAIRRFYFEIRVKKTTGPILFGLVERNVKLSVFWKRIMESQLRHHRQLHVQPYPCYLANDVAAWPPIDWHRDWFQWNRDWVECLRFFSQQSIVSTTDGKFANGDVLGCGLLHFPRMPMEERPMNQHQLFFTRNGQLLGEPIWVSPAQELFPFICLASAGTSVSANFGEFNRVPYAYNIGQHNGPIGTE